MKTIGLIGGMSWESSIEYYRIINETVKKRLGGLHSCESLMYSVDFSEVERLQHEGEWDKLAELMISSAKKLEAGGADFVVICTNTMHKVAEDIERSVQIPLLHIGDAVAEKIISSGMKKVGLLGTRFTMEEDFYKKRLNEKYGIEVIIPKNVEIERIHSIIYNELVLGDIRESSRIIFNEIINGLISKGAEGIILGCTEIPLLVRQEDISVELFDTTRIHAEAAVEMALK